MNIPFGIQTVTVVQRGASVGTDQLGNPQYAPTATDVPNCSIQPEFSTETLGSADRIITRWRLFAPPQTDLSAVDSVMFNGETFSIDGDPALWFDWYGKPHHQECYLRKATG